MQKHAPKQKHHNIPYAPSDDWFPFWVTFWGHILCCTSGGGKYAKKMCLLQDRDGKHGFKLRYTKFAWHLQSAFAIPALPPSSVFSKGFWVPSLQGWGSSFASPLNAADRCRLIVIDLLIYRKRAFLHAFPLLSFHSCECVVAFLLL